MEDTAGFEISTSNGLIAAVVQDAANGDVLMVGYMNRDRRGTHD